jgi:hypothetical protein
VVRWAKRGLLIFLCVLAAGYSFAQTTASSGNSSQKEGPTQEEKQRELNKQAFALLDQLVAESKSLSLPQNHITVEQAALELLWKRDRNRAKALVSDITGRIIEMENRVESDPDSTRSSAVYQLRTEMIQLLAGFDPRMALTFLQTTRPASGARDNMERQLEYTLTSKAASSDPHTALALAKKSLNDGLSYQLNGIYSSLSQNDPDAANELAEDIVGKLRSQDLTTNRQSWFFALNFLGQVAPQNQGRSGIHPKLGVPSASTSAGGGGGNANAQPDPQVAKQITELLVAAAASPNMPQDLVRGLQPYSDVIAEYAPGKAPQIQRQLSQAQQSADPQVRSWEQFNQANSKGSVEDSLAVAAQASPEMRSGMYQQVAWKAANLGDYLRARQIVLDDISDPLQRNQMLREITRQAAFQAASHSNFDLATDLMQGFTPAEEHATVLAQIAQTAAAHRQLKTAQRILEQARGMLDSRPENASQLNALLQVAQVYADVAPASGFQIVESITGQLNELVNAASMLDGFTPYSRSFESGEMLLHNGYIADSLLRPFARTLAKLAPADFGRAKAVADSLQPSEARVMAHMEMVKQLLVD